MGDNRAIVQAADQSALTDTFDSSGLDQLVDAAESVDGDVLTASDGTPIPSTVSGPVKVCKLKKSRYLFCKKT